MKPLAPQPRVSVIMPARNASPYIRAAISSLQVQTFPHWVLYAVNDCSADDTADIIADMADNDARIHIITNAKRLGVAASRNRALEQVATPYVAFLDSDDLWHPAKLATQIAFMEQSGTPITYGDYWRINHDGRTIGCVRAQVRCTHRDMLNTNHIGNLTGIFDRTRLPSLHFQNVGNEDYLFWLCALAQVAGPVLATPSPFPLASYRVTPNSLTGSKLRSARWQWHIYRHCLSFSRARSSIHMAKYIYNALIKRWPRYK